MYIYVCKNMSSPSTYSHTHFVTLPEFNITTLIWWSFWFFKYTKLTHEVHLDGLARFYHFWYVGIYYMTTYYKIILMDLINIWEGIDPNILDSSILLIRNKKKFLKKVKKVLHNIWRIHLTTIKHAFQLTKPYPSQWFLNKKFNYFGNQSPQNKFKRVSKERSLYLRSYEPTHDYSGITPYIYNYSQNYVPDIIQFKYFSYWNAPDMYKVIPTFYRIYYYKKTMYKRLTRPRLLSTTPNRRVKHRWWWMRVNKLYTNKLYTNKLYTNKLYTNKLYTNKWNRLWLIQLRNKILFYTKAYHFCKLFSINSRLWLNKYHLSTKKKWFGYYKQRSKILGFKSNRFAHLRTHLRTRFRLRPGYSILWRRARNTLRKLYKIKSKYQHLLTRHLNLLYKYSASHQILLHHYTLKTALISIYMAHNPSDYIAVMTSGVISVNNITHLQSKDNLQLYVGDQIQFTVSWITFLYFLNFKKYALAPTRQILYQWRRLYFKRRKKIFFKRYHQLCENFYLKFPPTLKYLQQYEIDHMVGSAVLLYPILYWWETNQLSLTYEPLFDTKMYNWKYIT